MYKKQSNINIYACLVMFCILVFAGCGKITGIQRVKPAEISLGNIKTLAILKFEGIYGEVVRNDFYNKLSSGKHFNLIDTTRVNILDKVIFDQIDDTRFLPDLKALKADGVIIGRVTGNIRDIPGIDQVKVQEGTGKYKKEKNIAGQEVDIEIMKTIIKPVRYVIRQAFLTVDFKVFDLRNKQIAATNKVTANLANAKYGGENEYNDSGHTMSKLPSKNQTLNELSDRITRRLVAKISPTSVSTIINTQCLAVEKGIGNQ